MALPPPDPSSVALVTGASSGIGEEFARQLSIYGAFAESDRDEELRQLRVNVEAVVDLTARYLPGMVERGGGAIVNLSSSSGLLPEFQKTNSIEYFGERVPKFTWVPAERVVADALKAVEKGKRAVIPGSPFVKMFLGSARWSPSALRLVVAKRIVKPS